MKAEDFKVGDKIVYSFSDLKINGGKVQKIRGKVVDHFGDGIFVALEKSLEYFDSNHYDHNRANYNYQDWMSKAKTKSFELFDGEYNDYGSFDNIELA